jgi:ribulose-5-phosphate 4-epimerase/fuculose-1-phosphate aldolase
MIPASAQGSDIVEAARALASLGLVTAFGHVSARAGTAMLITPAADLSRADAADLVTVPLGCTGAQGPETPQKAEPPPESAVPLEALSLPAGAPAEAWLHLALYRARPDVQAIARAQPASAFAAAATASELVPLHGQAAWLGESVPVHDSAHLLRSAQLAERAAARLPAGEALLLRGNGAVTVGATPGLAVTRMWLLAVACETWLAAQATGRVTALTAEEIQSWRVVAPELLPRLWNHLREPEGSRA